jgi:predicted RNA-binding protein with PUA-like domain
MAKTKQYWLFKCEPEAYSIDDLERDGSTGWEGVRNYQARNLLRDEIRPGDEVLFYASNADPSGVSGLARVTRAGFPDPLQFEKGDEYFDPGSDPAAPRWFSVEIGFVARFPRIIPLAELKTTPGLEQMQLLRKGNRLSVQPVTREEFEIVKKLGRR